MASLSWPERVLASPIWSERFLTLRTMRSPDDGSSLRPSSTASSSRPSPSAASSVRAMAARASLIPAGIPASDAARASTRLRLSLSASALWEAISTPRSSYCAARLVSSSWRWKSAWNALSLLYSE